MLELINVNTSEHAVLPRLFDGQTPRLRELSLCRIRPWPANQFRGLTSLALSCVYRVEPGLDSLLELLCESPLLLDPLWILSRPATPLQEKPTHRLSRFDI